MIGRARAAGLAALAIVVGGGAALWPGGAAGHYPPRPKNPCGTDAVVQSATWDIIKAPPGMTQITSQAAGGADGKLILATDGRKVMRSADGGCTWGAAPVYTVPTGDVDGGGALPSVGTIVFPDGDASLAFLLIDGVGRAAGSQLLASTDGGQTWAPAGDGLPSTGHFQDVLGLGAHLYLTVAYHDTAGDNDPAGLSGAVYRSVDGGRSWEKRSDGTQIERLAVDPLQPDSVWVVRANHAVERSFDGGQTFSPAQIIQDPDDAALPTDPKQSNWRDLAVTRRGSGALNVVLVASDSRTSDITRIAVSEDGGRTFKDLPVGALGGPVTGVAFGNAPSQLLLAMGSDSTAFHGPGLRMFDLDLGRWADVDTMTLESLRETRPVALSAASRGHEGLRALQFRRDAPGESPPVPDVIARYIPPDPPPDDGAPHTRSKCVGLRTPGSDRPLAVKPPVTFDPGTLSIPLDPGQPSRVDLKAHLTAVPTPLDAYFLIDGSNSMDAAINGVTCSVERLARELSERGVDARYGIAAFGDRYARRYQRLLDLTPFGSPLLDALDNFLQNEGRGTPVRSALYQTATGAGLDVDDDQDGQMVHVHIDPGLQAGYRPGALHTAIVIADEPQEEGIAGEPSPDDVIAALKAKQILALGVQVVPPVYSAVNDPDHAPAQQLLLNQQLTYIAQGSGALAPPGGVDCNGDGQPDIPEGQPLVCRVDEHGIRETMVDTLARLLTQFRETADIRLVPQKTDGLSVSVEGGDAKGVNIRQPSELAGTAVLACTAEQLGQRFDISFAVVVGSRTVGTLPARATCGRKVAPVAASRPPRGKTPPPTPTPSPSPAPAKSPSPAHAPPAVPAPAPPHPAAVVAPAPPPPAPAPVTPSAAAAPTAASAPAANPAPSPAGATAAAPQRERAPQVAVADHAMTAWRPSAARRREVVPAPALITLGLGVCGAFGFFGWSAATRRRPRMAPERVRSR